MIAAMRTQLSFVEPDSGKICKPTLLTVFVSNMFFSIRRCCSCERAMGLFFNELLKIETSLSSSLTC